MTYELYIPGLTPSTYESDEGLDVVMWHNSPEDHLQRYYTKQKPVRCAPIMKDWESYVLGKTILELVKKGHVHYTDIEKKRLQHACALQHQTQSENSSITIRF